MTLTSVHAWSEREMEISSERDGENIFVQMLYVNV